MFLTEKKTFILYFAKAPILPQFRLIRTFINSKKNVCPLRVRISGCALYFIFLEKQKDKLKDILLQLM